MLFKLKLVSTIFLLISTQLLGQEIEEESSSKVFKIGVKSAPPFVLEDVHSAEGVSLKLWNQIALNADYQFDLVAFDSLEELLEAVEKGDVDFSINPVTVTDDRLKRLDFSQPFYISTTVAAKRDETAFVGLIKNVFSWNFLSAVGGLFLVILIFGLLIWFFERKANSEEFGEGLKGVGDGFWWSAVTMTTVGYGDKSPKTLGGRLVAIVWMFAAIIIISGLTAAIASSLTVKSLDVEINSFRDIAKLKVGSVAGSSPAKSLSQYHASAKMYNEVDDGLKALANNELDFFIYDKPIIDYYLRNNEYETDLEVANVSLRTDYYSFSFPKESPYLDEMNVELVKQIKSIAWQLELAK